MERFWTFFLTRSRFTALLGVSLIVFGLLSVWMIPKESAPEVQVPIAIVTTVFPGASAADVERLVTDPIEDQLDGTLDRLSSLTSTSRRGISTVIAEFDAQANIDESVRQVKDEVDKVVDLPSEAEEPRVSEINFVDQPIMLVSVSSDLPPQAFISLTEEIEGELKLPGVSRVEVSGVPEREMQVVVRKEALAQYNISLAEVVNRIAAADVSIPIGSITQNGVAYSLQFENRLKNRTDVGRISIPLPSGGSVFVGDIADVVDGVSDRETESRISVDGTPSEQAATFSIFKRQGESINRITADIRDRLDELQSSGELLADSNVLITFDTGEMLQDDLENLSVTGLQTVLLVMGILFFALGAREAMVAGLAIPASFLIAFVGLYYSGNTLNFVSLFSLILAIGILVDAAIVVTEAIHTKIEAGMNGLEAARATIAEFHAPLLSGTATTIAVFVPLFFISGVTGEFIASIPFTIIFVLCAALFVALGFIPIISSRLFIRTTVSDFRIKQQKRVTRLQLWYQDKLQTLMENRRMQNWLIGGIGFLFVLTLSFPAIGVVDVIFFPPEDTDFLVIEVEERQGTVLERTDQSVRLVEEVLHETPEVESFVTTVGAQSSFNEGTIGEHFGNITVNLTEERTVSSMEVAEKLRSRLAELPLVDFQVQQPESGPPTGAPVVVTLFGENLDALSESARRVEGVLSDIPGAVNVSSSAENEIVELGLHVNRAHAASLGITPREIAGFLRTAVHGTTAAQINTVEGDDVDIVVKTNLNTAYADTEETSDISVEALDSLRIPTRQGSVLLGSLVTVVPQQGSTIIRHEDAQRITVVSSQIADGYIASDVTTELQRRLPDIELPAGVNVSVGGENEEVNQSFQDMFTSLFIGLILIVAILVLQFNSFKETLFIISTVPLSLIGVIGGLALTGKTLSFPSILGFIALAGIVVNNGIILVDVMNRLQRTYSDRSARENVVDGATRRLRPVLLTTLTTAIGVLPLTYASELWAPLAYALIFGLLFASTITLILVPTIYYRWSDHAV